MSTPSPRVKLGRALRAVILLSLLLASVGVRTAPTEYEVKAAFIYYFAKFVDWPASAFAGAGAPLVIGICGSDPFDGRLDQIVAGKSVNGRPLEVRRLSPSADLTQCHILYISPAERRNTPVILQSLANTPVLTVSEIDGFTQSGGIINFFLLQSKVKFEISPENARQAELGLRAQLLRVAVTVEEGS